MGPSTGTLEKDPDYKSPGKDPQGDQTPDKESSYIHEWCLLGEADYIDPHWH